MPQQVFAPPETIPSAQSTLLDDCVVMHWLSNYYLGAGVNAVTGRVSSGTAIKDVEQLDRHATSTEERYSLQIISTGHEVRRELGLNVTTTAGQYLNIAPMVDCLLHGMAALKRDFVASTTTLTFLVLYQSETTCDTPSYHYELTDDAAALALSDPNAFRVKYGDYFIAGAKKGSIFAGVAKCTFQSSESRRQACAALGARATSALNFETAAHIDRALSSAEANIYIRIHLVGLEGNANKADPSPPMYGLRTFAEILPVLDWFKKHQEGVCLHAMLRHYSTVARMSDVIQKTLPVVPSSFVDIEDLRDTLLSCGVLVNGLPEYTPRSTIIDGFHSDFRVLSHQVHRSHAEIVLSSELRTSFLREARRLEEELTHFHQVREFVHAAMRDQLREPGGVRFDAGETWTFGMHLEHSVAACKVEQGPTVKVLVGGWKPFNNAKGLVKRRRGEHIVGWSVTANNPERSSWRKDWNAIILGPEARIACRREHGWRTWFKMCTWTLTTFVVRNNAYFDLVVDKEHTEKTTMTTLVTEPKSGSAKRHAEK